MPSANTVKRDKAPPEDVEQAQDATLLPLEQLLQLGGVDTGHGDVRADSVDDQRQQQEDQTTLKVAELAALCQLSGRGCHAESCSG